ncbi:MAG TPA: rhodanese-like domain-containing protein [Phycisphaerae bacterium]|nr:rhodanese-like domain-containing protein [Phycisphaerae bacterium]
MLKPKLLPSLAIAVTLSTWMGARPAAGQIKDAESATHADSASEYQIVDTYKYPGFEIVQFTLPVLSHYSYIVTSGADALVVDPGRDVQTYLNFVKEHNLAVKGVFLTHSHADFVAGHLEMAKATGCPICVSATSGAEYEHQAVKEGDQIVVGEAVIRIVETPGHTPDGLCGYVFSKQKSDQPVAIFTGDTLFVGSIGRPDLLPKTMTAASLASMAYDTWHNKLSKVTDETMIFPAHGAGSLCGAHLRDEPFSTIGAERASNPYFQHAGRSEFIAAVLEGLPEAPQYFSHNAAMNRQGPELVDWNAPLPAEVQPSSDLADPSRVYVVDIRSAPEYAAGHIPNSVNIALRGRFESWIGRMVPWGARLVLYGAKPDLEEAARRLHRVGYKGDILTPGSYAESGLPLATSKTLQSRELHERMQAGTAPIIVDVRLPEEWMGLRIGTVVNLPIDRLSQLARKLDPAQPTITVCNSAYRSSMALGVLEREGFKDLYNLEGGAEAWIEAGLPVLSSHTAGTAASASTPKREVRLAERICANELRRLMMDLPNTFDLADIRPPEHFADYSLPGSINVDVAELLDNPAYLTGAGPLIVVDRDGSLAMMVAGILSQKTQRTIKAVYGGLEAYWSESMTAGLAEPVVAPPAVGGARQPMQKAPEFPSVAPQQPQVQPKKPAKKSAGC